MKTKFAPTTRATTLLELMIAVSIGAIVLGMVYTGAMSMHRCFAASMSFAEAKREQTRLSDYIAMDLRRADSVTVGGTDGVVLTATMQDYYDEDGAPRTPTITKYVHSYGDPTNPMVVRYIRNGQHIYRQERTESPVQIASGIAGFEATLQNGGRVVETSVKFTSKFGRTASDGSETVVRSTTLLRNYRRTSTP